ncbi:hypothetical protein P175DRAFT_0528132 [Aspergillus ochraceoroseus IBT 24754]|uniref:Uncharacterized protein n=1 Tax=Aspergillus ochraceoroseus IBT 24754 TaxID=1392256 RepID=A0A2T5M7Y7_9EURO|nr:uncharacterized protein P175DRAFT_0528132 [Aspergillus ochraceoroseus IBT 24754]PTU24635.1 hypothetical protein P175DRAFT_0528132 [Aspergillus ochraceoroseus IBT 24754]
MEPFIQVEEADDDDDAAAAAAASSLATELAATLASLFRSVTVLDGLGAATAAPAGNAPHSGSKLGRVSINYYQDDREGTSEYILYQYYAGDSVNKEWCPEVQTPGSITTAGAWEGMNDGTGGFKVFGSTCTYKGSQVVTGKFDQNQVGSLVCDGYRDAACYAGQLAQTCTYGWQTRWEIIECEW